METRTLPVKLTPEELDQRRDRLAELVRECNMAKQVKKDHAAVDKKAVDDLEKDKSHIAREIREKAQHVEVQVIKETDIERGVEETIRIDTHEVVSIRRLDPSERQAKLFHDEAKSAAEAVHRHITNGQTVDVP